MNMASIGVFIFTVIITAGNAGFVNVRCKTENVGQYGQQSLLECTVEASQEATDAVIRTVSWKKEGVDDPLLVFHNGKLLKKQPGYSFAEPSWNNGNRNVSLHINDTAVEDQGVYTCMVLTDRGATTSKTSLKVTAKYSKPTIVSEPMISQSTGGTLVCTSVGGYPKGQIRWFGKLNEDWTKSAQMEVNVMKDGLLELSSKLTLLPGSTYSQYTCAVFNTSGGKEDEATFEVPKSSRISGGGPEKPSVTAIVAPLLVIGSLIVGLLVLVILYKRRSQLARRFSTTPLMSDHREVRAFESDAEEGGSQVVDKEYQDTLP